MLIVQQYFTNISFNGAKFILNLNLPKSMAARMTEPRANKMTGWSTAEWSVYV